MTGGRGGGQLNPGSFQHLTLTGVPAMSGCQGNPTSSSSTRLMSSATSFLATEAGYLDARGISLVSTVIAYPFQGLHRTHHTTQWAVAEARVNKSQQGFHGGHLKLKSSFVHHFFFRAKNILSKGNL